MAELGWAPYALPSRGVLYEGKLPDGKVEIRPFKGREQALLQQQGGGIIGKIDAILRACVRFPDTFKDPKELLLTDRFAILLAQRTKTFGPKYEFEVRCRSCGAQQHQAIDITEDFNEVVGTEDLVEPFPVELTDCGKTVHLRFIRGMDDDQIAKNAKRMQMQSNDGSDPSYLLRVAMQIVKIDGEDEERYKPLPFRQKFVEELTASDLIELEDAVNEKEPGIDTRIYPECRSCGYTNELTMPFDAAFFRPRRRRRSRNA
jgi:hypothetical protein